MSKLVVGHGRFDAYPKDTKLEIVDEPLADRFHKKYSPKVINAKDYNLGIGKKVPEPVVERTTDFVTLPKHTAHDLEIVTVSVGGETHRVPRWMVRYLSGQC